MARRPRAAPGRLAGSPSDSLAGFSVATRTWFTAAFVEPTPVQVGTWDAVRSGRDVLAVAPTGSGKTLAAFLWSLDRIVTEPRPVDSRRRLRVLYISPMKALAADVECNLRAPLAGIQQASARLGLPEPDVQVALRTGDTPPGQRRRLATRPPDVLITTPESLFLLLTARVREVLRGVDTVIVDEVHAVAGSKRGAHLAVSLERLDALLEVPARRIGLSATVRPVEDVARFLGGMRDVTVVAPPANKRLELEVVVPVADLGSLAATKGASGPGGAGGTGAPAGADVARASIWPHVEERIVDLVQLHRSTIVFANSRRLAERLCARLNEIAYEGAPGGRVLARAHHGSVSKEQRALIEEELKSGQLPAVVATSSLELGIDMDAVDLVVQVESPPSVAAGLQRVGRSGHQVGAVSRGVVLPTHRGDLVQAAVVAERMVAGQIEQLRLPRNPLDVLAQQVVAMVAVDVWDVDELLALLRRADPFASLPRSAYDAVLDMLAGRYPSDAFAELRPRLVWDRVAGTLTGRPGAQRLAVTSGGTIPDRGLYGVFLVGEKSSRVGELDEEMVYESRVGDVVTLGSSSWRIESITHDRVLVTPAPGQPGRLPFWKGDALGRPAELGVAVGRFICEVSRLDDEAASARLTTAGLDEWAAGNLLAYLRAQRAATGHVPDDRTILVERFRDELGDWRVAIHSPYGAAVHAPWALALTGRLRERLGIDVQSMYSDDGIVLRLPETDAGPPADLVVLDPAEVEAMVTAEVGGSALFAARFRECAARALLLPRRDPGRRSPLWQQRQRSAQLLSVAAGYGSFPIVLETMREVLHDVFDVPALVRLMRDIEQFQVRVVELQTRGPSPFARSLLFGYVAQFLYEGDSPLAERRAAALALDTSLLAELLGRAELRELLDAGAVTGVQADLQRTAGGRQASTLEGVADLLGGLGPLTTEEVQARVVEPASAPGWLSILESTRRVLRVRIAGYEYWAAVEDAGRLRDALGARLPGGVPEAFLEPVADPMGDLVARYARTHGPFRARAIAERFGLGVAVVRGTLIELAAYGRVVDGSFTPGGAGTEWCATEVLRLLRRRSLAALRHEAEPVPAAALARFLPAWQGVGGTLRGVDGVLAVVEQLAGAVVCASALDLLVLPARVADYTPMMLDELTAAGEVVWAGQGALPGGDGWVSLHLAETAPLTVVPVEGFEPDELQQRVLEVLDGGTALFFRGLLDRVDAPGEAALADAVWGLVWSGRLTNDTLAPLRIRLGSGRAAHRARRSASRARYAWPRRPARGVLPARSGLPSMPGRWSLLPAVDRDATRRAAVLAQGLLDRHGVVTRGVAVAEHVPGGFAAAYRVLSAFEEAGRCRRGYAVEGLGAAQFAAPGAVDRLRGFAVDGCEPSPTLVLAATDPANPYGAALAWPEGGASASAGHRPGRKAGALVVLVAGALVLYVERGGRTMLSFTDDPAPLQAAADALALAVHAGQLGRLQVQRADGASVLGSAAGSALSAALSGAGFRLTPRGLRLRG